MPWTSLLPLVVLAAAPRTTVLFSPVQTLTGVERDQAELFTTLLVAEASRRPGYRVVSMREVEQMLSHEHTKQLLDCSSGDCVAEIAGTLNAQQVVFGTMGRVGTTYVVNLARLRARDSLVLVRVNAEWDRFDQATVLGSIPRMVSELLMPTPDEEALPPPARSGTGAPQRWALRGVSAGGLGGALLAAVGGGLGMFLGSAVVLHDLVEGGRPWVGPHAISATEGLLGNLALGTGGLLGVTALVLAGMAAALLLTSVVLP